LFSIVPLWLCARPARSSCGRVFRGKGFYPGFTRSLACFDRAFDSELWVCRDTATRFARVKQRVEICVTCCVHVQLHGVGASLTTSSSTPPRDRIEAGWCGLARKTIFRVEGPERAHAAERLIMPRKADGNLLRSIRGRSRQFDLEHRQSSSSAFSAGRDLRDLHRTFQERSKCRKQPPCGRERRPHTIRGAPCRIAFRHRCRNAYRSRRPCDTVPRMVAAEIRTPAPEAPTDRGISQR